MDITILGIESSCDDTSAAVIRNTTLLSNVIASQAVHVKYGGVIPELASRAHQQNIIPVVDTALKEAGVSVDKLDAIAFTRGPGLLGSLLVGTSFAKGLAVACDIPLVEVNHLQGHILSHFIDLPGREMPHPDFPFLCLLVSGGHTQIVRVDSPLEMQIIGTTIDDAAGEAFDKCAKVMGLPYPGGPVIDKLAKEGDPNAFTFAHPHVKGEFDYSFSGLKTSFLYTLRDEVKRDPDFRHCHRRRRLGQFGPAQCRCRGWTPPQLAHLHPRVEVHYRQRGHDRHLGLLPLLPRPAGRPRHRPRSTHRRDALTT